MEKNNKKIYWSCRCSCGKEKWVRKDALLDGKSKGCGHDIYSQGSKKIKSFLEERKILFKQEYCFSDLLSEKNGFLRFDFAIFDEKNNLQYLIEYDGEQHFKEGSFGMNNDTFLYRKNCDVKKEEYCRKKNIPLYRIPYYINFSSLEEILNPAFLIKK